MKKPPPKKIMSYIEPEAFEKLSTNRVLKKLPCELSQKLKKNDLINLLFSSLSLSTLCKFNVIANLPVMEENQFNALIDTFNNENERFKDLLEIKNERVEVYKLIAVNLIRVKELLYLLDEINLNEDRVVERYIAKILALAFKQYPTLYFQMNKYRNTSEKIEYVMSCYECYVLIKGGHEGF